MATAQTLPASAPVSTRDKATCVSRELNMRHRVYPRWVANGKMTAAQAEREIAVMAAIKADYDAQIAAEAPRLL